MEGKVWNDLWNWQSFLQMDDLDAFLRQRFVTSRASTVQALVFSTFSVLFNLGSFPATLDA